MACVRIFYLNSRPGTAISQLRTALTLKFIRKTCPPEAWLHQKYGEPVSESGMFGVRLHENLRKEGLDSDNQASV